MKRSIFRATVALAAAITPLTVGAVVLPAAQAATVSAQQKAEGAAPAVVQIDRETPGLDADKTQWRELLGKYRAAGFDNVKEVWATSPAMGGRNIPLLLIQPKDASKRENVPTLYLLNGADGGEGKANWLAQTDVVQYYGGNNDPAKGTVSPGIGANIVIPMAGGFSYYTDWNHEAPSLGGKQMWETFLTKELPQALEPALNANDKRAIAGMSMSATTSLVYAQHHPGFYDAVGSFSGCASTTTGMAPQFIDITLNRGGANMGTMWDGPMSETARNNDALLNAEKLRGQGNIYVSNGSGLIGQHDVLSSDRVRGNLGNAAQVAVEGGIIEAATNQCTHDLAAKTRALNIPVNYNFRPQGTHQWGYWEDDLRAFWPQLVNGLGTGVAQPPATPISKPVEVFGLLPGAPVGPTGS